MIGAQENRSDAKLHPTCFVLFLQNSEKCDILSKDGHGGEKDGRIDA